MYKKVCTMFLVVILTGAAAVFAQNKPLQATISKLAGKVEVQLPGKDWRAAKEGELLPKGTMISTGFKSSAVLTVNNSSILVKPVTRMKLEEIVQTQSGTSTQVYLSTGKLSVEVTPQQNQTTDFTVSSPTATASVRGTGFDFDGIMLIVHHGVVALQNVTGQTRQVTQQQASIVSGEGDISVPAFVTDTQAQAVLTEVLEQQHVSGFYNYFSTFVPNVSLGTGAVVVFTLQ
ncbi:MAG TPA: FecR domain-containing protein [Spirochaetia bacterium]|nr:FecR domain-containing protein [Spirochaetales bacterium]HRS64456.1 FecR domain-containing protein [Spirochaetia bacterium]HPD81046.1 FecR domain-containing protein [Spirochaetales bacterium]HQG40312.1 FecR domain-containing protein [Spirochaetales bacterium]HQK34540.1 FecR domain-containing protein [Spirochaetales bacterium]